MKYPTILFALLLALTLLLSACGAQEEPQPPEDAEPEPFTLSVSLPGQADTLDPLRSTAQGTETILHHLFENLMRWEDSGDGWAVLAPGQAESYTVETDYAGNATYTFTLREGLQWSDGRPIAAGDFVSAWQRIADPANDVPHRALLSPVAGYGQVQETGDASLLAVSAPDRRTFVVSLEGSCAWFLEEVCASPYTVPRPTDLPSDGSVTNGPYTAVQFGRAQVVLEPSETYHSPSRTAPEKLVFFTGGDVEDEYLKFQGGSRDLVLDLPASALQELAAGGTWLPEPVTSVYGVLFNTRQAPFDDPSVRLAFRLAVDTAAVTEAIGDPRLRAASGVVPYGVTDYGAPAPEEPEEEAPSTLPDPSAPVEPELPAPYWDFRAHSLELVTVPGEQDYTADCLQARTLLSQAGYPNGSGFPAVEYIYVRSDAAQAAANALCALWRRELGVTVTARGLSQEDFDACLAAAQAQDTEAEDASDSEEEPSAEPFTLAARDFTPSCNDAGVLLDFWRSTRETNLSGYRSDAFDILLDAARAAESPEVRDAYLHDAEAILLQEVPVVPVCYHGGAFQLSDRLSGLYRLPDGVYFLGNVREESPSEG